MGYGEIKALATGDPDFLRQSQLESDLARLERLARAHGRDTISAGRRVTAGRRELAGIDQRLAVAGPVVEHLRNLDWDRPWSMTVGRRPPETNRGDAARAIEALTVYSHRPALVARYPVEGLDVRFEPLGGRAGRLQLVTAGGDSLGGLGAATVENRTASSTTRSAASPRSWTKPRVAAGASSTRSTPPNAPPPRCSRIRAR